VVWSHDDHEGDAKRKAADRDKVAPRSDASASDSRRGRNGRGAAKIARGPGGVRSVPADDIPESAPVSEPEPAVDAAPDPVSIADPHDVLERLADIFDEPSPAKSDAKPVVVVGSDPLDDAVAARIEIDPVEEQEAEQAEAEQTEAEQAEAEEAEEAAAEEQTIVAATTEPAASAEPAEAEAVGTFDLEGFRPQRASKLRIGDILKEMGLATDEQIENALARQKETRKRLGQLLVEDGVVTELDLSKALASKFGVNFLDLTAISLDAAAVNMIPEKLARRYGAVPVKFLDDSTLLVAMVDPMNVFALDDLKIMTGCDIQPAIASEEDIFGAISRMNRLDESVSESAEQAGSVVEDEVSDIRDVTEEAPIVKLVNSVIAQSVDDGASDIHFEPQAKELMVRFRIDGVLHEVMSVPRRMQNGVISRLKIMAELDIAERRVPQDGRIGLVVGGKPIDMRVATLPTVYGEKVVMRLLDKSNVMLDLTDLGFSQKALKRFQRSFTKPYGAILVTGPTGSGKSTTLYAALNILNSPEKNIITVEDPVEYRLAGINQVQTNVKAGLTFATGLRSILRCDPDIVMIGEIRDRETAQIAIESALTGHLVLSTLHTNDAPGALSRITEMGIEPFLTSSAVDCVLAQRLARRLCSQCKEAYTPSQEMLRKNDFPPEALDRDDVVLYRTKGCSRCNATGYKGRLGLYEVMIVSEAIRRLTVERKSADEISRVAAAEGMKTLREDGLDKVLLGLTSVEEIARVIV
jgi:type IV pilus assembly protein PilB